MDLTNAKCSIYLLRAIWMSNPASSVMVSTHFNHHSPVWTDSGNALVRGSYPLKKEAKRRDQTRRLESVDEIKQDTCINSGWDQTRNTWNQWLWTCLDIRRNFAKPRNLPSNEIYARYCGANLQQIDVPLFYNHSFFARGLQWMLVMCRYSYTYLFGWLKLQTDFNSPPFIDNILLLLLLLVGCNQCSISLLQQLENNNYSWLWCDVMWYRENSGNGIWVLMWFGNRFNLTWIWWWVIRYAEKLHELHICFAYIILYGTSMFSFWSPPICSHVVLEEILPS